MGYVTLEYYNFVDREEELNLLDNLKSQCFEKKVNCGVLIYGWRRVGKTTLVKKFVSDNDGIMIDCSWISDPKTLLKQVLETLRGRGVNIDLLDKYEKKLLKESEPMLILNSALNAILDFSESVNQKLIVALDEFHVMLEKLAYRIARETKKRKDIVVNDILWLLRGIIESKKAFWILTTSMGWGKLKELYLRESKEQSPLTGVLYKLEVKPLTRTASFQLVQELNSSAIGDAEIIYELSGGIPRIIEILASNYKEKETIIATAAKLMTSGQFDEIFENIIKFVAEASKRDYTVLINALRVIKWEGSTPEEVAKELVTDRVSAYNILEDLTKMGLLEKIKTKGRVRYKIVYPMLQMWLKLRVSPTKSITQILASRIGIIAESYIRDLLREYANRQVKLEIYDNESGTFLLGTINELSISIEKVLTKTETEKRLKNVKNADIIIIDKNKKEWLIEVKATIKPITHREISKLENVAKQLGINNKILVQLGDGQIEPKAISEAIKTKTILISKEAVKMLAKKINYPIFS